MPKKVRAKAPRRIRLCRRAAGMGWTATVMKQAQVRPQVRAKKRSRRFMDGSRILSSFAAFEDPLAQVAFRGVGD